MIIGTELLNGRRTDSHFSFLNAQLVQRGWIHKANFVIKDDPDFLHDIFTLILNDPDSVMFSFGGIGSTPDDFTREVASKAFTGKSAVRHLEAEKIIIDRLKERAYPHPIKMADIPESAKLIENPFNKMPGFQLQDRFFFVPGFPEMAHPMCENILDVYYPQNQIKHHVNFVAHCGEAMLIDIMEALDSAVELSCLPSFDGEKRHAEIYLAHSDSAFLASQLHFFKTKMREKNINFTLIST
ncbi:MAG: competence/damage-inducible protein A [Epsilonproteobacteria bacterium]|nr:competence/damage-inducible protein A [Campylobacterota bacterium]